MLFQSSNRRNKQLLPEGNEDASRKERVVHRISQASSLMVGLEFELRDGYVGSIEEAKINTDNLP